MSCSKRRLTKQPYCKDDPKCYWDKRCKTRKITSNSLATSNTKKLDLILERITRMELMLTDMNKTRKNKNVLSPIDYVDDDIPIFDEPSALNRNNNEELNEFEGNMNNVNSGSNMNVNMNNSFNDNRNNDTASIEPKKLLNMYESNNNNRNANKTANKGPRELLNMYESNNNNNRNKTAQIAPENILRQHLSPNSFNNLTKKKQKRTKS